MEDLSRLEGGEIDAWTLPDRFTVWADRADRVAGLAWKYVLLAWVVWEIAHGRAPGIEVVQAVAEAAKGGGAS